MDTRRHIHFSYREEGEGEAGQDLLRWPPDRFGDFRAWLGALEPLLLTDMERVSAALEFFNHTLRPWEKPRELVEISYAEDIEE